MLFLCSHDGGVRMFLSNALWEHCVELLSLGVAHHKHEVAAQAAGAFLAMLRCVSMHSAHISRRLGRPRASRSFERAKAVQLCHTCISSAVAVNYLHVHVLITIK